MISVCVAALRKSGRRLVSEVSGFPCRSWTFQQKDCRPAKEIFSQAVWSPYLLPLFLNSKENQNNNKKSSEDEMKLMMMMPIATGIR